MIKVTFSNEYYPGKTRFSRQYRTNKKQQKCVKSQNADTQRKSKMKQRLSLSAQLAGINMTQNDEIFFTTSLFKNLLLQHVVILFLFFF